MSEKDRRVQRTKRSIREAFFQLIQQKNLDSITVKEISELADVDRKTFYAHYNSVYDVLGEFESELESQIEEMLLKCNPDELEKEFMFGLTAIMKANIDFYRHVSSDVACYFMYNQCEALLRKAIVQYFIKNTEADHEKHHTEIEVYSNYIASGICGVYTAWLAKPNMELEQLVDFTTKCISSSFDELVELLK